MEAIGKNIAKAFVAAQKGFGAALKTSTNPHFKSKYADLSACVEAVIDALNANGIALMQKTYECNDGVMVETVFLHESGEVIDCGLLHVPAGKHDAQGYGSALTYARRYSLLAATGMAPEDDDGNHATAVSRLPDATRLLEAAKTIDELKTAYAKGLAMLKSDADKKAFIKIKDSMKEQIDGTTNA